MALPSSGGGDQTKHVDYHRDQKLSTLPPYGSDERLLVSQP